MKKFAKLAASASMEKPAGWTKSDVNHDVIRMLLATLTSAIIAPQWLYNATRSFVNDERLLQFAS